MLCKIHQCVALIISFVQRGLTPDGRTDGADSKIPLRGIMNKTNINTNYEIIQFKAHNPLQPLARPCLGKYYHLNLHFFQILNQFSTKIRRQVIAQSAKNKVYSHIIFGVLGGPWYIFLFGVCILSPSTLLTIIFHSWTTGAILLISQ